MDEPTNPYPVLHVTLRRRDPDAPPPTKRELRTSRYMNAYRKRRLKWQEESRRRDEAPDLPPVEPFRFSTRHKRLKAVIAGLEREIVRLEQFAEYRGRQTS